MPRSHLLVVDADPQSLRVLEVSLRKEGYSVAATHEGRIALRLLEQRPADVALVDTRLGDMDGFAFVDAMRAAGHGREAAVILLASDPSIEARVRGLEHGIDDYVPKPFYINEIIARVQLALQRREHAALDREAERGKTPFAGALETTSLVDLLQMIEHGRRTGVLYLGSRGERGAVYFRDGRLVDAEIGALRGERAVHRALTWNRGVFEADFRDVRRRDVIDAAVSVVLMEGMRRLDEWSRLLELLPGLDHVLERDAAVLPAKGGSLAPDEQAALSRFDGERSLAEVVYLGEGDELDELAAVARLWAQRLLVDTGRRARPTQVEARPPGNERPTAAQSTWDYEKPRAKSPAPPSGDRDRDSQADDLAQTTPGTLAAVSTLVRETAFVGGSPLARARRLKRERKRATLSDADGLARPTSEPAAPAAPVASPAAPEKGPTTWPEIPRPPIEDAAPPSAATIPRRPEASKHEPRAKTDAEIRSEAVTVPRKPVSAPAPALAVPLSRSPFPLAASRDVSGGTKPQLPRPAPSLPPPSVQARPGLVSVRPSPVSGATDPGIAGPPAASAGSPTSKATLLEAPSSARAPVVPSAKPVPGAALPGPTNAGAAQVKAPQPNVAQPIATAALAQTSARAETRTARTTGGARVNAWEIAAEPEEPLTVPGLPARRRGLVWGVAAAGLAIVVLIFQALGGDPRPAPAAEPKTEAPPQASPEPEPSLRPSSQPESLPQAAPVPEPASELPPQPSLQPSLHPPEAVPSVVAAPEAVAVPATAPEPAPVAAPVPAPAPVPAATPEASTVPAPEPASDESPMTSASLSQTALGHLEAGRNKKAIRFAERAVAADPTNSEGWIVLGAARAATGDGPGSREAYRQCVAQGVGQHVAECRRLLR